jgi:hypothetical protein
VPFGLAGERRRPQDFDALTMIRLSQLPNGGHVNTHEVGLVLRRDERDAPRLWIALNNPVVQVSVGERG